MLKYDIDTESSKCDAFIAPLRWTSAEGTLTVGGSDIEPWVAHISSHQTILILLSKVKHQGRAELHPEL